MKLKLTDGRTVDLLPEDINPFGQVYLARLVERGLAENDYEMCKLLGAAACDIRYGMVHPQVDVMD